MGIIGVGVSICWVVWLVVWLVSSLRAKRNIKNPPWWQSMWFRAIVVIILYILFWHRIVVWTDGVHPLQLSLPFAILGLVLLVVGIGIAFWARFYLGRNWGMPMTRKVDRELVTSGPYTYIRHPIYAGIFLALIGTAFAISLWWLVVFVFYFLYFLYSARTEEAMLAKELPNEYPAYKARTKMLIPFVF